MRLEAVGKRYGLRQPWVVRAVSLDVPAGRLIRVEGRERVREVHPAPGRRRGVAAVERDG